MRLRKLYENAHVLEVKNMEILFSYETPVAAKIEYNLYKTSSKYSRTTTKHINAWLQNRLAMEKDQVFFDNLL